MPLLTRLNPVDDKPRYTLYVTPAVLLALQDSVMYPVLTLAANVVAGYTAGVGVRVLVGVRVRVGVDVGFNVAVDVAVRVGVRVKVAVAVRVGVRVKVAVAVDVAVRVAVGVMVDVAVRVAVAIGVAVGHCATMLTLVTVETAFTRFVACTSIRWVPRLKVGVNANLSLPWLNVALPSDGAASCHAPPSMR